MAIGARASRDPRIGAALVLSLLIALLIGAPLAAARSLRQAVGHHTMGAPLAVAEHQRHHETVGERKRHGHRLLCKISAPVHQLQEQTVTGTVTLVAMPLDGIDPGAAPPSRTGVPAAAHRAVLQIWRL